MHVLLSGFYEPQIEALRKRLPVNTALYLERRKPDITKSVKLIPHNIVSRIPPDSFSSDIDENLRSKVRRASFNLFRRTHNRTFDRTMTSNASWLDTDNHFESALQFFWKLLRDRQIDTIVFNNAPHIGATIVLYHLAKALNLKTIILCPSVLPDYIWISDSIEGLGISGPEASHHGTLPLKELPERPIVYINPKKLNRTTLFRELTLRCANTILKALVWPVTQNTKGVRKSFLKLKHIRRRYNAHNLPERFYSAPDPAERYIYFPLHFQPEMSTDSFGLEYCDQILAIEQLARHLPEDVLIYVKENPIQTAYMRESSFYERLLAIPSVRYLRAGWDSFQINQGSIGCATICGTAGWETLMFRKPVITFGLAWYRDLPGCFAWQNGSQQAVDRFLAHTADQAALTTAVRQKEKLLWPGLSDPRKNFKIEGFDRAKVWGDTVDSIVAAYNHYHNQ